MNERDEIIAVLMDDLAAAREENDALLAELIAKRRELDEYRKELAPSGMYF